MSRPKAHAKEHSQLVNAEHSSKPVQTSPAVWTLIALQVLSYIHEILRPTNKIVWSLIGLWGKALLEKKRIGKNVPFILQMWPF